MKQFCIQKNGIILLFALLFSMSSYSQIDSISVDVGINSVMDTSLNLTVDQLEIEVGVYPISSLGEVTIDVYDENGSLQAHLAYTMSELVASNAIQNNKITKEIELLDSSIGGSVHCLISSSSGAHHPVVITNYNPQ